MKTRHGIPIEKFMGYDRNFLGSGFNCPELKLFGFATEDALNRAIKKYCLDYTGPFLTVK